MPVDPSAIYSGYVRGSRPRLPRRTLDRALGLYKIKFADTKGLTDAQIRRMAAKAVIARRRAMMAKK